MRTLVFGGSFNPPHIGHFAALDDAMREFGYDRAIIVPAARPPHKASVDRDPGPRARLEMVAASCEGDGRLAVLDLEIRRDGPSFMIDTIRELVRDRAVDGKPGLLIGDDLVGGFSSWKDPDSLAEETDLVVARRIDADLSGFRWKYRACSNRMLPISSTDIRERISGNRPFRYLLRPGAFSIIVERGLYGLR